MTIYESFSSRNCQIERINDTQNKELKISAFSCLFCLPLNWIYGICCEIKQEMALRVNKKESNLFSWCCEKFCRKGSKAAYFELKRNDDVFIRWRRANLRNLLEQKMPKWVEVIIFPEAQMLTLFHLHQLFNIELSTEKHLAKVGKNVSRWNFYLQTMFFFFSYFIIVRLSESFLLTR